MMRHIVRSKCAPIGPFENIVILLVGLAEQTLVFFFLSFCFQKNLPCFFCHRKASAAALDFRLILFHGDNHLTNRVANQHHTIFKINTVPLQAEKFAAPQSIKRCDLYKRLYRITVQGCNKLLQLLRTIEMRFMAFSARHFNILTRVRWNQPIFHAFR